MMQNTLVCDINDNTIQKRLLAEDDKLTLAKALSLAQAYQTAVKDVITYNFISLPKNIERLFSHSYSVNTYVHIIRKGSMH